MRRDPRDRSGDIGRLGLAADLDKTLRVAFPIAETGFDPQAGGDAYSNYVNRVIFDTLYTYDYLARPFKIVPNTAVALPEISADGKTWTIKIRPGIYFADDPAFKGEETRAHSRRLHLRLEARTRSENALHLDPGIRRQDWWAQNRSSPRRGRRQVRL